MPWNTGGLRRNKAAARPLALDILVGVDLRVRPIRGRTLVRPYNNY